MTDKLKISKDEVMGWAMHVALYDAEARGLIIPEVVEYLENSIDKFARALLDGKVIRKEEDGKFSIVDPDDSLVVGDDIG